MSSSHAASEAENADLADEVAAINAIYGDHTLEASRDDHDGSGATYILALPGEASSLRLQFPADYPAAPPAVLGTYSAGEHARRGTAARDLGLFRGAVGAVFQPGQVCLFDAVEEVARQLEALAAAAAEELPEDTAAAAPSSLSSAAASSDGAPPRPEAGGPDDAPWVLSDPVTEMKSTFVARCCAGGVASADQARRFVAQLLASDRRVRSATHNITAWRIRGPGATAFQDCDDDGETAAGGRLLHLMQLMDLWDAVVVVTRWYGGQKLGPRRFALINQVARDAFAKAGLVAEAPGPKKKSGHGGR